MATDRKRPPETHPNDYRYATRADILDPNVNGFYADDGTYWRKNGQVKTWKTRPTHARVPVKYGLYNYDYVDQGNVGYLFVRIKNAI